MRSPRLTSFWLTISLCFALGISMFVTGQAYAEQSAVASAASNDVAADERDLVLLGAAEKQLLQEKADLENAGQTAENLRAQLTVLLDGFSNSELQAVLAGDSAATLAAGTDKVFRAAKATALASAWNEAQGKYQDGLDRYTNSELDFFIKSTMIAMRGLRASIDETTPPATVKAANESMNGARKAFSAYVLARKNFGGPKDGPKRTGPYREFFAHAKKFFDATRPVEASAPTKKFWAKMKERAASGYLRARLVVGLTPPVLKTLVLSWTKRKTSAGQAPLQTEGIHEVFRAVNKFAGLKINVDGRENLPVGAPLTGKKINLVVPTHRNPMLDGMLMSALDLKSYLLVMEPMPLFGDVDSLVAVKHGAKPIDKVLEQLASGKTDTILIYPEGSVGAGLLETRPVREKFVSGLLASLRAAGYDVSLVPVTYMNSARFVDKSSIGSFFATIGSEAGQELNAKVGAPIDSRLITLLENAGSYSAVGRFLRATWLETLPTDEQYLNGALRLRPAADRFRELLHLPLAPSCRELFVPSR